MKCRIRNEDMSTNNIRLFLKNALMQQYQAVKLLKFENRAYFNAVDLTALTNIDEDFDRELENKIKDNEESFCIPFHHMKECKYLCISATFKGTYRQNIVNGTISKDTIKSILETSI